MRITAHVSNKFWIIFQHLLQMTAEKYRVLWQFMSPIHPLRETLYLSILWQAPTTLRLQNHAMDQVSQAVTLPPPAKLPVPLQPSSHPVHTNVGSNTHMTTLTSKRDCGMFDMWKTIWTRTEEWVGMRWLA